MRLPNVHPLCTDGMIASWGWIAVALVVFGTWKTGRIAFRALLFGMVSLGETLDEAEERWTGSVKVA